MQELNNQYFTYRQSPALVKGKARIKSIKGNTLVWNQLVSNGNFTSTTDWTGIRGTISASGNVLTYTCTEVGANLVNNRIQQPIPRIVTGHNYAVSLSVNVPRASLFVFQINGSSEPNWKYTKNISAGWNEIGFLYNADVSGYAQNSTAWFCIDMHSGTGYALNDTVQFRNVNIVDITLLNDSYITDYSSFKTYFPLSYYQFDSGSLLNFNGTGIKTVGKNQIDVSLASTVVSGMTLTRTASTGSVRAVYTGGTRYVSFDFFSGSPYINGRLLTNTKYKLSFDVSNFTGATWTVGLRRIATNYPFVIGSGTTINANGHYSITLNVDTAIADSNIYVSFSRTGDSTSAFDVTFSNIQMELGTTETSFEPYTTSTTSLPISTYFPTGMKSAGSVYDELSDKAITRVESVDLGSLTWYTTSDTNRFNSTDIKSLIKAPSSSIVVANITSTVRCTTYSDLTNKTGEGIGVNGNAGANLGIISLRDTSVSSVEDLVTKYTGVYLNYELATYTEQDVDPEDTQILLNRALSTVLGRNVSVDNPQEALDILTKGE